VRGYYICVVMHIFSLILIDLQAAIAARAARDRAWTVLLVALWGRVGRARARLERLIAQWRAGTLPKVRAARVGRVHAARVPPVVRYPTKHAWLSSRIWGTGAFGSQLEHALLTDAECQAFLAAVPQAGRILRPLLRMLGVAPVPEVVVRRGKQIAAAPAPAVEVVGIVVPPVSTVLSA
jgi:hypothetical protein